MEIAGRVGIPPEDRSTWAFLTSCRYRFKRDGNSLPRRRSATKRSIDTATTSKLMTPIGIIRPPLGAAVKGS